MPSVIVRWSGFCPRCPQRDDLLSRLGTLAALSHSYLGDTPFRLFDETIEGNIVVSGNLLRADRRPTLKRIREAEPDAGAGGIEFRAAGPLQPRQGKAKEDLYVLRTARLRGLEFRLYDGRGLYPDEDRVSFVFVDDPEHPELDGALVIVEDHAECLCYTSEFVQRADWFLTVPNIHLRYYLEEWMDLLLGWVKHFTIPDLWYRRYEELPHYEVYAEMAAENTLLRDACFEALQDMFRQEVADWSGTAAEVAAFWSAVKNRG